MAWTTPKTNFTATDYYNFSDINRVESNTEYLYNLLLSIGYSASVSSFISTRINTAIEYYDSLNRVEGNIKALKDASYQPIGWLSPKINWQSVVDNFSYIDANRLESNLDNLKTMIDNIISGYLYCGDTLTSICGKGNTLF